MRKFYTAEAVTEGHPDKLCDQIADAILDVCLKQDERSRVACEVLATKGTIIVAGEITSTYEPDVFAVVRKVLFDIGYSSEEIKMDTFVHQQSPDIAGAVDTWVTEEEYQAAKQVRAYEYLQTYQPGRLKKTRTRNEWQLQDHDSFKINELTSKWHWKSRGIGGMSALRFLMQVDGMRYTEAVKILCEQTPVYVPRAEPAPRKKLFSLPLPNDSFYRVRRYLNQRGIRDDVLDYCVQLGILYESAPYHNAVFVGLDEQGQAKYAFLRGIYDSRGKNFKMEQEGSNKQYSFCVPPLGKSSRVAVYEACIDALAHMTLEDGRTDKYRLSLGGIAAPKEGAERATKKMKRPDALEYFLKEHPEVTEIELCTDNDFAGRWACAQLKEQYEEKYTVVCNLPQMEGADYGDLAKQAVEKQKKQQKERGR